MIRPLSEENKRLVDDEFKPNSTVYKNRIIADQLLSSYYKEHGVDEKKIKNNKVLPIRLYTSNAFNADVSKIEGELIEFLESHGISIVFQYKGVTGSWGRTWIAKTIDDLSFDKLKNILLGLFKDLEEAKNGKAKADINEKNSNTACNLLNSLESTNNAVCQVGNLLVIKNSANDSSGVLIKTLSDDELRYLEENQSILMAPNKIIEKLSQK